jgi:hypothetical protein
MSLTPAPHPKSSGTDALPDGEVLSGRSQLDLMTAQVRAVDAWARSSRLTRDAAQVINASRERRLDLSHRMEARRREQAALIARVDQQLHASGQPLAARGPVRAVLGHRNEWLSGKVASRLERHGIVVVGCSATAPTLLARSSPSSRSWSSCRTGCPAWPASSWSCGSASSPR